MRAIVDKSRIVTPGSRRSRCSHRWLPGTLTTDPTTIVLDSALTRNGVLTCICCTIRRCEQDQPDERDLFATCTAVK
ncbi:hypothetical protein VSR34_38605, partial [Paraburkholderia sp. JHI2823]|uniref:hypothetical protein n=1 Tax=Paraburkholderia sp. JHI2823 TaxID=3112960 RepID=UPI003174F3A0